MKKFYQNIALFLFPFLFGIVGLFFIPVNKKFSYHFVKGECENKASWIYQQIFENTQNIDIVFSGASQTGSAIMDNLISEELSKITGTTVYATNLGYCRRGRDIQYVMLKDLFKLHNPKILVLEVYEDEPKKSHPVFPYLAENTDLFGSVVFFNQRYFVAIWKGIILRFEILRSKLTGEISIEFVDEKRDFGYRPSAQIITNTAFLENQKNWTRRFHKTKPKFIRNIELNYSKHYLEKIIKLARNNKCQVLFLYLPESGSNLKKPLLLDYYKNLSEVIILPEPLTSKHENWKDATHFNDTGAAKASENIISYILKEGLLNSN